MLVSKSETDGPYAVSLDLPDDVGDPLASRIIIDITGAG